MAIAIADTYLVLFALFQGMRIKFRIWGKKMEFLKSDQKLKLVLRLDHVASVL